jgi:hypothetical protein
VQKHDNNTTTPQGRQARVRPCCAPATRFIDEARPVAPSLPAANTTTNTIITIINNHTVDDIRYEDIHYRPAIVIVACFAPLSPP